MGDFIGFSFDGVHSSDLGIVRVSGGDRYDEELIPEITDRTAEIPGRDGNYYFGTDYGPRKFEVDIAFDSLTEVQFRRLRQVFSGKKTGDLIFDERPYKKYTAKIESPPELSYVCFDEPKKTVGEARDGLRVVSRTTQETTVTIDDSLVDSATVDSSQIGGTTSGTQTVLTREQVTPWVYETDSNGERVRERIYKGEGKISFVCYFPFARAPQKAYDHSFYIAKGNVDEWRESAGLKSTAGLYDYDWAGGSIASARDIVGDFEVTLKSNGQIFATQLHEHGDYVFTYDSGWQYNGSTISSSTLEDTYGIVITASGGGSYTPSAEDSFTIRVNDNHYNVDDYISQFRVYNPGDVATPLGILTGFRMSETNVTSGTIPPVEFYLYDINDTTTALQSLVIEGITKTVDDYDNNHEGIFINGQNHLIEHVEHMTIGRSTNSFTKTGLIYNEKIVSGDFFMLPPGFEGLLVCKATNDATADWPFPGCGRWFKAVYDYLYY